MPGLGVVGGQEATERLETNLRVPPENEATNEKPELRRSERESVNYLTVSSEWTVHFLSKGKGMWYRDNSCLLLVSDC